MLALRASVSIVVLPGTVPVLVLVWILRRGDPASLTDLSRAPGDPLFWISAVLLAGGLGLLLWTISLFARHGRGTLAPWDPPRRLVLDGPYRHVRNPMITGVATTLVGEALLFRSLSIAAWALLFFSANAIYFPLVEEPGLRRKFGEDYSRYCANVPRWLPRLRASDPSSDKCRNQ